MRPYRGRGGARRGIVRQAGLHPAHQLDHLGHPQRPQVAAHLPETVPGHIGIHQAQGLDDPQLGGVEKVFLTEYQPREGVDYRHFTGGGTTGVACAHCPPPSRPGKIAASR